jgi:hypothetical protein
LYLPTVTPSRRFRTENGVVTINCHHVERAFLTARIFGSQVFWQLIPLPEVIQSGKDFSGVALAALTQKDHFIL